MKSRSFVLSAIILALGGFFAKAIGALYKIPLTNILGSSGMGLYYLIFPVYSLVITFCSSGISVGLSTEVAKCRKMRHRYNEQKLMRVALVLSFVLSLIFAFIILIIARPLADAQGNVNASLGYIAIAPAIIISSIIATLRGYFQGVENMVPTTVSMIIEQIVKLSFGLILAHKLCIYGIQYAVLGAIIGVTISEVVALIIISINFFTFKGQLYYNYRNMCYKGKKKIKIKSLLKSKDIVCKLTQSNIKKRYYKCSSIHVRYSTKVALGKLLKVVVPATLSSIIIPIATMIDSFIIINLLIKSGYSSTISTSLYGLWGGIVQTLISLPIIVIAGVSTSLVPSLSGVVAGKDVERVNRRVQFFIKITWVLAVAMFIVVFVFAEDILYFLYGDGLHSDVINELYYATKMLKMASVSIIYFAFMQTFTAILQSIGKSHIPFISLLISVIVRVLLTIVLVSMPSINIFGAIIAQSVFLSLSTILMAVYLKRHVDFEFNSWKELFSPLIAGAGSMAIMLLLHMGLSNIIHYFISMIITAIIGLIIFVIWVYYGKVFNEREKKQFFFRKKSLTNGKNKQKVS